MQKYPRVGVGVCIIKDGKILLGQRQMDSTTEPGSWCPPGGKLDFGEKLFDCARRETLEESGVEINNLRIITATNDIFEKENLHYITVYIRADYASGQPQVLEPDKMAKWDWFSFDELPQPLFAPFSNLLNTGFRF